MPARATPRPCPYRPGDGLYGYRILSTYTSNFSDVLICEDPDGLRVVLKTPADPADYERFRRQVKWWRALCDDRAQSQYLVRCIGYVRLEHKPFAVLEFVNGPNLRTLLHRERDRRLSIRQAIVYALQFCHGMIGAHARTLSHAQESSGFAHRDICPENIMIAREEDGHGARSTLKINDFGLARVIGPGGASGRARRGFTGRPNYAAPELFVGSQHATIASDVYAFGVTMWEMVAGRVPFELGAGESLDGFRRRLLSWSVPRLDVERPDVPAGLERVLDRCLEKQPGNRYRDFRSLQEDLEAVWERAVAGARGGDQPCCARCGHFPNRLDGDGDCPLCRNGREPDSPS